VTSANCKHYRTRSSTGLFVLPQVPSLNKFLQEQMEGLTAKVFRTYNASITLQQELAKLTPNLKKANGMARIVLFM
jgi:DNA topoisomerase-1